MGKDEDVRTSEGPVASPEPLAPGSANLWKYFGWFTGAFAVLTVLLRMIVSAMDSSGGGGLTAVVPFLAAVPAVEQFVKNHDRVPTTGEKWWLITSSFGFAALWSVVSLLILVVTGVVDGVDGALLAEIVLIGLALTFVLVWAAYAWLPERSLTNARRRATRRAARRR